MNRDLVLAGIAAGLLIGIVTGISATRGLHNPFRRERTATERARRWAGHVAKDWARAAAPVRDGATRLGESARRSGRDVMRRVT